MTVDERNQITLRLEGSRAERGVSLSNFEHIEAVDQGEQAVLFTHEQIPDADLLDRQGVTGPQGLDALVDPEWDETTDDVYLAALTGDALEAC